MASVSPKAKCFHAHSPAIEGIGDSLKKCRIVVSRGFTFISEHKGSKVVAGIVKSSQYFHVFWKMLILQNISLLAHE